MKTAAALVAALLVAAQEEDHHRRLTPAEMERYYPHRAKLTPDRLETYAARVAPCDAPWSREFLGEEDRSIRAAGRVHRDGEDLHVGKARFRDDHSPTSGAYGWRDTPGTYEYIGVYAKSGLHLVHVQYYEGDGYILVDPLSGDQVEFAQPPVPSPSGRYFASASDAEAYNFNGVQIAERTPTGLRQVAAMEDVLSPCGLRWRSDNRLTVRERPGPFHELKPKRYAVVIELRNGAWKRITPSRIVR